MILFLILLIQFTTSICIYNGPGASDVNDYVEGIKEIIGDTYSIRLINAQDIIEKDILSTCSLFVMPGGADKPYCAELNGKGNEKIKKYISSGGSYLGICAGSYYASSAILFDENGPDYISEKRELSFYQGIARGPLFKQFVPGTENGIAAVNVTILDDHFNHMKKNQKDKKKKQTITLYYNGGPIFCYESPSYHQSETIGVYEMNDQLLSSLYLQPEKQAYSSAYPNSFNAIVFRRIGKGKVLLSSIHLENNSFDSLNNSTMKSRKELFGYLLKKLGLKFL